MGALGLALFSALSWGTADFFGGLTTRRFGILLVGVISQGAGLVLTGAFIVIGGSPMPDERGILFGVAAGVCATVRLVSVPVFLIALLVTRAWRGRHPTPRDTATMVGVGLLDNLANLTFALAGQTGLLALISVVGALFTVATVLLAWTLLKERLTSSQWVGVAMAFAGVGLIAAG